MEGRWLWRAVVTWKRLVRGLAPVELGHANRFTGWMSTYLDPKRRTALLRLGLIGADLDAAAGNTNDVTFTRRYLDQNRVTYEVSY